ncbi:MAG TPA: molybdenum ABC transporter ATP-binding protein [SAR202 cluster bacterium]|nr:molybdenum ABC transporter ATP-binding protein [SAR202 cluster bacterium]
MPIEVNVTKKYGDFELMIQAAIGNGITGIFGPSASGKSTLLNCIAGFEDPDDGLITLNSKTVFSSRAKTNVSPEKRRVGYVHQHSALFPHLTVKKNLEFGYNLTEKYRRVGDLEDIVHLLQLEQIMDRGVINLSGGERQRVALARSLAASPDLLLLDEPLASLDMPFRGFILEKLREVSRGWNLDMIYVSHSVSEMIALADSVIVIRDGMKVVEGNSSLLLNNSSVADYVDYASFENILHGVVDGSVDQNVSTLTIGDVKLITPKLTSEKGKQVTISIKASDIIVSKYPPVAISARNILKVSITNINHSENPTFIRCETGGCILTAALTMQSVSDLGLRVSDEVYLIIKANSVTPMELY